MIPDIDIYHPFRARVKIRRDLAHVRAEAEKIDGKVFRFSFGWSICDEYDSEIYKNELAMIPNDVSYPYDAPTWIASGDLEILTYAVL